MPVARTSKMPSKIVVHSFMRETGKTNISAGLAHLLAAYGERVGIIDADISVPVLHSRLGVDAKGLNYAFNHYLMGGCAITDAAVDLTWDDAASHAGALVLVPASMDHAAIRGVLHQDIDVRILNAGIEDLATAYSLDVVLINAPAGLDEISLSCMALADVPNRVAPGQRRLLTVRATIDLCLQPQNAQYPVGGQIKQIPNTSRLRSDVVWRRHTGAPCRSSSPPQMKRPCSSPVTRMCAGETRPSACRCSKRFTRRHPSPMSKHLAQVSLRS